MKIANIVYEKELINHTKVEYVNYINQPIQYELLDKTLPTLYVGWSFLKACNPTNDIILNTDILYKNIITNELYWECSFDENKAQHVKGVESFINNAPQYYFSPKHTYTNLDPVFFQLKDIEDLMDVVPKKINISYNLKNEMLYLLFENKIWGINLKMYEFFQFKIDEILSRIGDRTNIIHVDSEGETYQKYYKILPNYKQLKRYIVVMLSK